MSEDERLEQRLQHFYDRVPDVEDALPFKNYLLKHGDSRMAWYLLGKQYAAKGETAKANYCFHQAGDIYEAFESKPAPEVPVTAIYRFNRRRGRRIALVTVSLLFLLTGLTVPGWSAFAPEYETQHDAEAGPPLTMPAWQQLRDGAFGTPPVSEATTVAQRPDVLPGIVAATAFPGEDGSMFPDAALWQSEDQTRRLLVRSNRIGLWHDWLKSGAPIATVAPDAAQDSSNIRWYDPAWCECLPSDPAPVALQVEAWKPVQEEKLALVSAIRHYRAHTGAMPEVPADLAGSYPVNHMAGWSAAMDDWFEELIARESALVGASDWPIGPDSASSDLSDGRAMPSGNWRDLTMHPLEIIVDKSNHRLAVVSGRVLLRNYAVGLGGERTPEGQFVISEKVRDPNGEPEGVFGSRGMTLSDTLYGIHGTNEPDSIGKDESLGCIRMLQEDIEELFDLVPLGTKVTIVDGGLPTDIRVPPQRFRLPQAPAQDQTNPGKVYEWLG